ncbi:trichohyalin [Periophthalmus magnuspinnatus]|uniref:trichohyalin n=1 Tax=Periophthalmus magnuspinnatus TaxID=409849 RepID=UPI00243718B0|nr:trichohyalin [Periophthalmus magnuspinnatus]
MRPKMSPILQQNNNNNYPCLSAAGPGPLPHKCSLPLPFSSRPELSLTGLPLIRGLRAWALCSRSRHQPGGPLGQAPLSHPRPADVHLSAEWGFPLGLDARQVGIGALVATLQTSEGSSRTQTQCLFLRTDRGSCLYPTAKTTLHTTPQHPGGMLRGWLRSKTGGTPTLSPHTGPNRARERSGRRWRKPATHTASRERVHFRQHQQEESRERAAREEPREEIREEPREGTRHQNKDQSREEPKEEHRKEPQEETLDQLEVQLREETRQKTKEEHREESKNPPRDQPRKELKEEQREEQGEKTTEECRNQPKVETREETRYQPTDVSTKEVFQMDSQHQEPLCHKITPEMGFRMKVLMDDLQSCSCTSREHVSADAPHILYGAATWDTDLMCCLCGSSLPGCVLSSPPAEGGNCTANIEDADPLMTSQSVAQKSPGERQISHREDSTNYSPETQRVHPGLESQRAHPSLNSEREHASLDSHRGNFNLESEREPPSMKKYPGQDSEREHPGLDSQKELPGLDSEREPPGRNSGREHLSLDSERKHPSLDSEREHSNLDSDREHSSLDSQREHQNLLSESQREHPGLDSEREHPSLDSEREHPSLNSQRVYPSLDSQTEDSSLNSQREHQSLHPESQREHPGLDSEREHSSLNSQRVHPSLDSQTESSSLDSELHTEHPDLDLQWEPSGLDSQRQHPSLDSQREHPLEDQEFGGFMQAPSVLSHECTSPPWSDSGLGGMDNSWDQVDTGSWAMFPQNSREHREDKEGQWWPLSSGEDRGPTPRASYNPVCVFTAAFPSPPVWSTADPRNCRVPTLTQLLRGRVGPEEGSPEQGLLDAFHDLNKMIVQGYKQASGVSQQLLQKSLSLLPPNTGVGVVPGNRRISPGHVSSKPRLL